MVPQIIEMLGDVPLAAPLGPGHDEDAVEEVPPPDGVAELLLPLPLLLQLLVDGQVVVHAVLPADIAADVVALI